MNRKTYARAKRAALVVAIAVGVLGAAFAWYVNDYYHADNRALASVADSDGNTDGVVVSTLGNGAIAFVPDNPQAGLIFYPGAKVQPEAYAPLLTACAKHHVLCVLVKPLFNLAILDANAADGIQAQFPQVTNWALAGHSMGGVAASDYLARHEDSFDAIVFLASYPSVDLSSFNGSVLSIVGKNDQVLNWENYESARLKLPPCAQEQRIAGGNHAQFGDYGAQAGDGTAEIGPKAQQEETAQAIEQLLLAA